ncbi:dihydrofolate reductase family protein [Modestobacter sp. VKM Ac-2978]|uniref:dihydrofolate reductase family protein n=1 Tax=Modestobacter sp. VKM Ac-2978 TaxID=3004132 RepID=UPI0022AAB66C|nr:dihydrofolate reductase family protein [Modestobacter sp. VKM Ac-2978]MCZ2850495.1 dihydrofolate reductase family protein [Modestobacter sp. VKM Ac-2978]
MRALTYYVGVTLDGFIAAPDGSYDFFPVTEPLLEFIAQEFPETLPTHVRSQLQITAPGTRFDAVVMGRATYEPALQAQITSPYAHLEQHVVSTTLPADIDPAVQVSRDPVPLVRRLKGEPGAGVWLAGGGALAGALLDEIDVLVLKRYPIVLGAGIPLFDSGTAEARRFEIVDEHAVSGGTRVTTYTRTT